MNQPDLVINAVELRRSFKDIAAMAGIRFRVHPGEIFGWLGANGAGKTSAICRLTGQNNPNRGRGVVTDCDIVKDRSKRKERKSRPVGWKNLIRMRNHPQAASR